MTIHRTFAVPLRDNTSGFEHRYNLNDVGIDPKDFHSFSYIDLYGLQYPSENEITEIISGADRVYCSLFVTDNPPEPVYRFRCEITSTKEIPSDAILKLVSLPDVLEVDTTLHHLSYMLKRALTSDEPTESILDAIKWCK